MMFTLQKWFSFVVFWIWSWRRADFYRDLADSFERRVNTRDFLRREIENRTMVKDDLGRFVMRKLAAKYAADEGLTLQTLFAGVMPKSDALLLSAVDDAKNRADALKTLAAAIEMQIKSARILLINLVPPLLFAVGSLVISVTLGEIIADITKTVPDSVWSGFNGFVRDLAFFINRYWILVVVLCIAAAVAMLYALPVWTGNLRRKLDDLPGLSLYRDYNAAVVLSSLSMMLSTGKTLQHALMDMYPTASPWLRSYLQRISHLLETDPNGYLQAFMSGLIPRAIMARMASLLDSTSSFEEVLISLGTKEVNRLMESVRITAESVRWALIGLFMSVAIILSIGQMTIPMAISDEMSPAKMMQRSLQATPAIR